MIEKITLDFDVLYNIKKWRVKMVVHQSAVHQKVAERAVFSCLFQRFSAKNVVFAALENSGNIKKWRKVKKQSQFAVVRI